MDNDHDLARQGVLSPSRRRLRKSGWAPAGVTMGGYAAAAMADTWPSAPLASASILDSSGVSVERLRREQECSYYNELYLLAPVGYFLIGFDSTLLQVNLVGASILGVARAEAQQQHFRDFVTAPFVADFDAFFARALNSAVTETCTLRLRASDGECDVTLHGSADGSGQACRVLLEQATGQHAALVRSEERFRRIVHSAQEGIWEIDALARTTFVNPKMAQMLGYQIEDMLGLPLTAFMDDDGRTQVEKNIARRQQGIAERIDFKFMSRDGRAVWTTLATNPIFDAAGSYIGAIALVTEIAGRKEQPALGWRQASFDALTGLPNRHMLMDRLTLEIRKTARGATLLALLSIDLDRFKDVNARLGPAVGDQVLVEASRRIAACVRTTDTLARLDGDQFMVILAELEHLGSVERIADSITEALAQPFQPGPSGGLAVYLTASIGIATHAAEALDVTQLVNHLVERADLAMYAAKHAGGQRYSFSTPGLDQAALARQHVAVDLRAALALHQFELMYQPIVCLRSGEVRKAEALVRWRHPTRGLLEPREFIECAESHGLMGDIGDWVFREAALQAQRWQGSICPGFQVSINKSPLQFRRGAEDWRSWQAFLGELALPPQSLMIDITEGVLFDGAVQVDERLSHYRDLGLQVALDDFGTGCSSLSHLTRFGIDYVKIDRSFVASLEDDTGDLALCEAIIVMAHKLGKKVVAEGVETKVQRALLVDAGCDYAQGYIFAPPMPVMEFDQLARHGQARLPH